MTLLGGRLLQDDDASPGLRRWLETLTLTVAAPVIGYAVSHGDPYWVHGPFPWLVFIPLLVGAEHGAAAAVISASLLAAGAGSFALRSGGVVLDVAFWSGGLLLVGALSGHFRDAGRRRRWLLDQRANGLAEQLERAQRARYLLQLSHDRMEERLGASGFSLDAALEEAARRMAKHTSSAELGKVVLDVLASQAIVRAASLYRVESDGKLSRLPVAVLGTQPTAAEPHFLVERAFNTRRLAAIVDAETHAYHDLHDHRVLVAVPLVTASGKLIGVLAVHRMSFMAFQSEQLRNLLVLTGQLADMTEDRAKSLENTRRLTAQRETARRKLLAPPALGPVLADAAAAAASVANHARLNTPDPQPLTPGLPNKA